VPLAEQWAWAWAWAWGENLSHSTLVVQSLGIRAFKASFGSKD
jgi:hypothetical protein